MWYKKYINDILLCSELTKATAFYLYNYVNGVYRPVYLPMSKHYVLPRFVYRPVLVKFREVFIGVLFGTINSRLDYGSVLGRIQEFFLFVQPCKIVHYHYFSVLFHM